MAATRVAVVALALLAAPAWAQKGQAARRPPPQQPPPPPPRADVSKDLGDFMRSCLQQAATPQEQLRCRARAKDEFSNSTRNDTQLSGGKGEAYFERFQRQAAEKMAKDRVRICLEAANQTQQQMASCMSRARTVLGGELQNYIKPGKSAQEKANRAREMEKDASREILGEVFSSCVQTLDRQTCMGRVASRKDAAGLSGEDEAGIVKRHLAKILMRPAQNCSSGDTKQCREDAKREAMSGGMKQREYAAIKQMGEIKAAAETWADCKDAGGDDATCEGMIRDEFVRVSGARDADFDAALKSKVKSLGQAIKNGEAIRTVKFKRMLVTAFTSGSSCATVLEALFAAKVYNVSKANNTNVSRAVQRKCRVVDLRPEYGAKVDVDIPDSDIDDLSEATSASLQGETLRRRLEEAQLPELAQALRRLDSVSEVFAAQDVAECGVSDAACASGTTSGGSPAPSPTPAPAPGHLSGAGRAAAAASWAVVAMVAASAL